MPEPDWKAPPRVKSPGAMRRAKLRFRSCPCGAPSSEAHHVLRRGAPYFGDDVVENLVPLCDFCHSTFHSGGADFDEVRETIGAGLRPDNVEYVLGKLGEIPGREFLLRTYRREID